MSKIEEVHQIFKDLGINPEIIRVYTNLQGYNIESFRDLDSYYDLSSYDDKLYNLLYED